MTRKIFLAVFIILAALSCEALAAPRLAIRPFTNKTDLPNVPVDAITDMMTTELSRTGMFNLLERERLDYLADEIRLGQSGLIDPDTAPRVGKIKGAQYTMTGAVTVYEFYERAGRNPRIIGGRTKAKTAYVTLDLRIIDNTTGEIVYAASEEGQGTREISGGYSRYSGFYYGERTYGGILASATRDAVMKHVHSMAIYE